MEVAYVVVVGILLFLVRAALSRFFSKVGLGEGLIWLLVTFLLAGFVYATFLDPERRQFIHECRQQGGAFWDCQRHYGRHARQVLREQDQKEQDQKRGASGPTPAAPSPSDRPVAPEQRPARIVSEYNSIYGPNGAPDRLPDSQSPHSGVDFGGNFGEAVIAPADGLVVIKADPNPETCGNGLVIYHTWFARYTIYCHLQDVAVDPGKEVKRGERIGSLGDSGAAGSCQPRCPIVHMELSTVPRDHPKANSGETFDPLQSSVGCFDPKKTYPRDRLVLTYPVRCKN